MQNKLKCLYEKSLCKKPADKAEKNKANLYRPERQMRKAGDNEDKPQKGAYNQSLA